MIPKSRYDILASIRRGAFQYNYVALRPVAEAHRHTIVLAPNNHQQ
jgi:hypothetical protein